MNELWFGLVWLIEYFQSNKRQPNFILSVCWFNCRINWNKLRQAIVRMLTTLPLVELPAWLHSVLAPNRNWMRHSTFTAATEGKIYIPACWKFNSALVLFVAGIKLSGIKPEFITPAKMVKSFSWNIFFAEYIPHLITEVNWLKFDSSNWSQLLNAEWIRHWFQEMLLEQTTCGKLLKSIGEFIAEVWLITC